MLNMLPSLCVFMLEPISTTNYFIFTSRGVFTKNITIDRKISLENKLAPAIIYQGRHFFMPYDKNTGKNTIFQFDNVLIIYCKK